MNETSGAIARWLEEKRRPDRALAAMFSVLSLGSGAGVFLLMALLFYGVLSIAVGVRPRFVIDRLRSWVAVKQLSKSRINLPPNLLLRMARSSEQVPVGRSAEFYSAQAVRQPERARQKRGDRQGRRAYVE